MPNRLSLESSPYLLQHANNPVDWFPWGTEALEKAKAENKLILISIGYSACHWCHVMERESFENKEIAALMNAHFVCIKVDREERTDIDQIYMHAVQMMIGQGGWPLNCFALPDGRPVYGGTYFQPKQWQNMLLALATAYKETPSKFIEYANDLTSGLQDTVFSVKQNEDDTINETLEKAIENIKTRLDNEWGGFKGAPKFPLPSAMEFILETAYFKQDKYLKEFIDLSLIKMANSGLYDQLGGGFARYSVDDQWKVPHFEKMLYDNAQLISLYAKAYQLDKQKAYKNITEESLAYISREMTNVNSGFYSAIDADSEGVEGKFYVWTQAEVESILGVEAKLFLHYFQLSKEGNWENGINILYPIENTKEILEQFSLTESELNTQIEKLKGILFKVREKREYPSLDYKSITAWNALMLNAYVDAFKAIGKKEYLDTAIKTAVFIQKLIDKDGRIKRIFKLDKIKIDGFLDDYAFSIQAFLALYQITFEKEYLDLATKLNVFVTDHFWDNDTNLFFYTSDEAQNLIARKKELTDNVIPASNSVMAHNLHSLGILFSNESFSEKAKKMLLQVESQIPNGNQYYGNWARLLFRFLYPSTEVVVMGENCISYAHQLQKDYHPLAYFVGSKTDTYLPLMEKRQVLDDTQIYVCKNRSCNLPTSDIDQALETIKAVG